MNKRISQVIQNESGIALIVVMLIVTLLIVMTTSVGMIASSNLTMNSSEQRHQSAYYIAESGIEYTKSELENSIQDIYHASDHPSTFFSNIHLALQSYALQSQALPFANQQQNEPQLEVTIEEEIIDDTTRNYTIYSNANINNQTRSLGSQMEIKWVEETSSSDFPLEWLNDMAVFTNQDFSTTVNITGDIGTNSSAEGAMFFANTGNPKPSGKIFLPPGANIDKVIKLESVHMDLASYLNKSEILSKERIYTLPPFPEYPNYSFHPNLKVSDSGGHNHLDLVHNGNLNAINWLASEKSLNLTNNYHFSSINMNDNITFTLNIGSNDISLVVDHLNITNGHLKINGTGTLTLYVKDKITMGSGSTINNNGDSSQLKIYLQKSATSSPKTLELAGSQKIFGSFYGEDTNIKLTAGGGFQGHIFTGGKNVLIDGGSINDTRIFLAPNADVVASGGGTVRGSIISNTFTATGGANIHFQPLEAGETIPFFPNPGSGGGSGGTTTVTKSDLIISSTPPREN